MRLPVAVFLARRGLRESRLSTGLMVVAVAVGIGFQVPSTANLDGYRAELLTKYLDGGAGDVRVRPERGSVIRDADALAARIGRRPGVVEAALWVAAPASIRARGKAVSLSPVAIGLLQEAAKASGAPLASLSPSDLAKLINAVPIDITGVAPIARAISTAGGVALEELNADFMIRRLPGVFAAGEMLDWEAPTGGYLLQASFATGVAAGRGALKWRDL